MSSAEKSEFLTKLSKTFRFQLGLRSYAVLGARVPVIKLQDPVSKVRIFFFVPSVSLIKIFRTRFLLCCAAVRRRHNSKRPSNFQISFARRVCSYRSATQTGQQTISKILTIRLFCLEEAS